MKAKIIDSFSYNNSHLQYNTSFLMMCSLIYSEIDYYCNKEVLKNIESLLSDSGVKMPDINHKYIFVVKGSTKLKLLLRYLISSIMNIYILISSDKNNVLIYNFNNLFSLHIINFINKFFHRKILICCHGELELFVVNKKDCGLLAKILRALLMSFFKVKREIEYNIYFIVLGDIIKDNLGEYISKDQLHKFLSIDHSYIFSKSKQNDSVEKKEDYLLLGTVGAFDKSKGGDLFIDLVSSIKSVYIKFKVIGQIFSNLEDLKKNNVLIANRNPLLPLEQDIFNKEVASLDYIIYLYKGDSYRLKASGAIMDAINMRKNIIALKNEYFEYIFNKYGAFGHLFDNINDMKKYISENVSISENLCFDDIQKKLSPFSLYKDLQKELFKISFLS